ncbi:IS66 family insertion sequence element accessory protein TnpA [Massilia eurypsychrophila]|jgi:hypothetical protein|uniref:IS66 family insertion sequence element accessory protein TnpA n=1 Tax=Massilia eurypsychrophila TaxID=1485217 RepID=UPI0026B404B4
MKFVEREALWRERVEQWRGSGLSQRAFARKHGYPVRQVGYWVRRLAAPQSTPLMLPVAVDSAAAPAGAMSLRCERGWMLTLPGDVPAVWLAELLRAL